MTHTLRPFDGVGDLDRVFNVLVAAKDAGFVDLELRSTSLRVVLDDPTFDAHRLTLLITDDGQLSAFGILWRGRYLGMLVDPVARGAVERTILAWASRTVAGSADVDPRSGFMALCRSDDQLAREIFEDAGLNLAEEELRLARPLRQPVEPSVIPAGFTIRPLDGESELPAWIALYEAAFGPGSSTVARRTATMRDPDYDATLDLVALDASGALAAMCTCSIASFEASRCRVREGKVGPVAVASSSRRLGLGKAIVLEGLARLSERGLDVAILDTDIDNDDAHRLYASVGFVRDYTACWYHSPANPQDIDG